MRRLPIAQAQQTEAAAVAWCIASLNQATQSDWGNLLGAGAPPGATDFIQNAWLRRVAEGNAEGLEAVIGMARNGSEDADKVLRRMAKDILDRNAAELPARLNVYVQDHLSDTPKKTTVRIEKPRPNLFRGGVVAHLVMQVESRFGLKPYRGRYSDPRRTSGCKVVSKALVDGNFDWPISEREVERIYETFAPIVQKRFEELLAFSTH